MFKEGIARFATVLYKDTQENQNNLFMHLTNYAINNESEDFKQAEGKDDSGASKRLLSSVLKQIESLDGKIDAETLMNQIEDVCVKTILAAHKSLA